MCLESGRISICLDLLRFELMRLDATRFDSFPLDADSIRFGLGFDAIRLDSFRIRLHSDSIDLVRFYDPVHCFDSLIGFIDLIQWFVSLVPNIN